MKYIISSLNVDYNQSQQNMYTVNSPGGVSSLGNRNMQVSLEIEVLEYQEQEIQDLDSFEIALKTSGTDQYLADLDLPPLRKILELHYPEKLL